MGAYTERVERSEQIKPALERAFNSGKPSVIDVVVDRTVAPTTGSGQDLEQRVKAMLSYMEPEDFPDEIRRQIFDKR